MSDAKGDEVRRRRPKGRLGLGRDNTDTAVDTKSWPYSPRVVARFGAAFKGLDTPTSSTLASTVSGKGDMTA